MTGGSICLHQTHQTYTHVKCDLYSPRPRRVPGGRRVVSNNDVGNFYGEESSTGLELVAMVAMQNKSAS